MKKLLLAVFMAATFISCSKDDDKPEPVADCERVQTMGHYEGDVYLISHGYNSKDVTDTFTNLENYEFYLERFSKNNFCYVGLQD